MVSGNFFCILISLIFGYPTDRQIGRETKFMAECGSQTRCYTPMLIYQDLYTEISGQNGGLEKNGQTLKIGQNRQL